MEAPTAWEREHRPPHGPRTDDHATYEPPAAYGEDMLTPGPRPAVRVCLLGGYPRGGGGLVCCPC